MTTPAPDTDRGLYRKYELFRVSEAEPDHRYQVFDPFFVLRYTTDLHARAAILAYADSCETDYPQLAADLRRQVNVDRCVGCGAYPDEPHPCVGT